MIQTLTLSASLLEEMITYVDHYLPLEACGVLAGKQARAEKMIGVLNQAQSPVRFVMDPYEQLHAFDWIESNGLDLVGIFHSHPDCDAYFSKTDLQNSCPWYSFVVLSIKKGDFDHANSFLPDADQTRADKENLVHP